MSFSPILSCPELAQGETIPEVVVNEQMRRLEGFASLTVLADRDLATPPGSCSDGARYLVAASPTGAWTGHAGDIAQAFGPNASNGWTFVDVFEGLFAWVSDEDKLIRYNGSAWAEYVPAVSFTPPAVSTQSGTSYTAVLADANTYIRFTSGSAVAFTIPPNSSVAFPNGTEISGIQAGGGALTVVAGAGVTLNSFGGDLSLSGQWAGFTAKKVATDTWDVIGKFA